MFAQARPGHVIVTTPNREYNRSTGCRPRRWRHRDHRFEWSRAGFATAWAEGVASRQGYRVSLRTVGDVDPSELAHPARPLLPGGPVSELHIPDLALVALVGVRVRASRPLQRERSEPYRGAQLSCRALVGDANDQSATNDAFDVLYYASKQRLDRGLLTVVDATNLKEAHADLREAGPRA